VYWTEFGRCADFLNGQSWSGGNTATLLRHGKEVDLAAALPGDLVFYAAAGKSVSHVAVYVGKNKDGAHMVVSHGSDPAKTLRIDSMGTLKRSSIRSYL
jgi:cell wall-associated NlpC family hydrolase